MIKSYDYYSCYLKNRFEKNSFDGIVLFVTKWGHFYGSFTLTLSISREEGTVFIGEKIHVKCVECPQQTFNAISLLQKVIFSGFSCTCVHNAIYVLTPL